MYIKKKKSDIGKIDYNAHLHTNYAQANSREIYMDKHIYIYTYTHAHTQTIEHKQTKEEFILSF